MQCGVLLRVAGVVAVALAICPDQGHADLGETILGENDESSGNSLLVFAQDNGNNSHWMLVSVNIVTGKTHSVLRTQRNPTPGMCGFALIDSATVAFFDYESKLILETWSLMTGNRTSSEQIVGPMLQTMDYNPASRSIEGVCQMWLPEQNMSATCWCGLQGNNVTNVHQLSMDYFEEIRDDCVNYIDQQTSLFWCSAVTYDNKNRFFVGLSTDSSSSVYDWKWFGVANGTVGFDAYAHDDVLNRSFAIQLSDDNITSQLVEVLPGTEPYAKDNPMPTVLRRFPFHLGLTKAGMAAYDAKSHTMYCIMSPRTAPIAGTGEEKESIWIGEEEADTVYLVRIPVLSMEISFQELQWPRSQGGLNLQSMRLWSGLPKL